MKMASLLDHEDEMALNKRDMNAWTTLKWQPILSVE